MTDRNSLGPTDVVRALMFESLPYFMSQLLDVDGRPLQVAAHHMAWCRLIMAHARLVLLAPRDHSKTTFALVFVMWMFFRHAIDPATGRPRTTASGNYLAVLFSATQDQASVLMARFRDLLAVNASCGLPHSLRLDVYPSAGVGRVRAEDPDIATLGAAMC